MKGKLLEILDFLKAALLWAFKILLRIVKALVEETIVVLQKLDVVLTNEIVKSSAPKNIAPTVTIVPNP